MNKERKLFVIPRKLNLEKINNFPIIVGENSREVFMIFFCKIQILFMVLFLASIVHSEESINQPELSVMCYNIKVGVGGGKKRLFAEEGLDKVAEIVEKYNPDILLVQEIEMGAKRSQFLDEPQFLKTKLGFESYAFAPAIQSGTWSYGVAIFLKNGKVLSEKKHLLFKPDYSKTHPDYPGYYSEQRTLLEVAAKIQGKNISLFSTHLGLTSDQRKKQVETILGVIKEKKGLVILGGDFNAEPDTPERTLLKTKLTDSFFQLSPANQLSFPAGLSPEKAIDTIYVSEGIEVLESFVIRDETLASDHNPIFVRLKIN